MHNSPMLQLRQVVHFFALYLACLGFAQAQPTKQQVELISDWRVVSAKALDKNLPIVLLVEISDCAYCKIVKKEFINPLARSERYKDQVIFSRISRDAGQTIIDGDGNIIDTREFSARYAAVFTPTVVLLDATGKQLTENLVGMSGRDYYGYYLEQKIAVAIKALQVTE